MPLDLRWTKAFQNAFSRALSSYPLAADDVKCAIRELTTAPERGAIIPGLAATLRKLRIPLKRYSIGKSHGLRLLYIVRNQPAAVIPVYIYKKGRPQKESDVRENVRGALKAVHDELQARAADASGPDP